MRYIWSESVTLALPHLAIVTALPRDAAGAGWRRRGSTGRQRDRISRVRARRGTRPPLDFPAHLGHRDLRAGGRHWGAGGPVSAALGKRRHSEQDASGQQRGSQLPGEVFSPAPAGLLVSVSFMHDPRALAQRDPRLP
jgi:hypothetical protein